MIGNPIVSTDFPVDYASGNGSTTAFTLSVAPASVNAIDVQISGVAQSPQTYTVSGTTLTFTAAPPSGSNNIVVRHKGIAGIPNTPSAASVTPASLSTPNALYWNGSGNVGVGTTSNLASSKLDVRGRTRIGSGTTLGDAELIISNDASATSAWNVSVRPDVGGANNDLKFLRFNSSGSYQGIAMQIDQAAGRVTMSSQPRFLAYRTTNQTGYNSTSTGDVVVVYDATQYNIGSNYNTSTGKFTAPVAGTYLFHASAHTDSTGFGQAWLVINGTREPYLDFLVSSSAATILSALFLVYLNANDTVGYHVYNASNTSQTILPTNNHTYFRGYLIS